MMSKDLIYISLLLSISFYACSGGRNSVTRRPLFKSLFYMGDKTGEVYKRECPKGKRAKSGKCKVTLKKIPVNFCDPVNFQGFKNERYIMVKELDFLR